MVLWGQGETESEMGGWREGGEGEVREEEVGQRYKMVDQRRRPVRILGQGHSKGECPRASARGLSSLWNRPWLGEGRKLTDIYRKLYNI